MAVAKVQTLANGLASGVPGRKPATRVRPPIEDPAEKRRRCLGSFGSTETTRRPQLACHAVVRIIWLLTYFGDSRMAQIPHLATLNSKSAGLGMCKQVLDEQRTWWCWMIVCVDSQ
jgi:hypothetical protein